MAINALLQQFIEENCSSFKQNSQSWIFRCPRCEKADKLYLHKSEGYFKCFSCSSEGESGGFKGRPEYALSELTGIELNVVKSKIYETKQYIGAVEGFLPFLKDPYDDFEEPVEKRIAVQWPEDFYPTDDERSLDGVRYLEYRGIPLDIAKQYNIRYCPTNKRVAFPVEENGYLYGWQARAIGPTKWIDPATGETREVPKVIGMKGLPRSTSLMFADRLRGSTYATLCEGPVDAIKAFRCCGVAAMGKSINDSQIGILRRYGIKTVYIALDPDAMDEIRTVANKMPDMECKLLLPPEGYKDLGEMTIDQVYEAFKKAPSFKPNEPKVILPKFVNLFG